MKKYFIIIILFCCMCSFAGLAQSSKTEDAINQMVAAGKLKRMGNALAIVVDKPSDTVQLRKKYENVFKKPDGSNYEIQFFIDPKYTQDTKQVPVNKLPDNNPAVNNAAGTPGAVVTGPVTNNNQGCFPNMLVFGESGYREEIKTYEWVVPQGIYKIKIECWSGGGDGFLGELNIRDSMGKFYGIRNGSGGGGGAYALAVIDVKAGDILKMNIPGGGGEKSVLIQLNNIQNSLLIGNGSDGKPGNQNGRNGIGGFVNYRNIKGIFAGKTISISGENGFFNSYTGFELIDPGGFLQSPITSHTGSENCGNGGGAAKLNNGGRGHLEASGPMPGSLFVNSTNGGFPGGGGGAGVSIRAVPGTGQQESKGAPGVVIIYY
jgi:hypothetical protein